MPALNLSFLELIQWTFMLVVAGGGTSLFLRKIGKASTQERVETNALVRSDEQAEMFAKQAADMAAVVGELRQEVVALGLQVDRMTVENTRLHSQVDALKAENEQLAARVEQLEAQLEQRK